MENLNLVELLRDCPTGIELDSTVFDNITFDYVNIQQKRVYCKVGKSESVWFTPKGGVNHLPDAKCVIFPKGKTTWEGFVSPCKFKDGDIITDVKDSNPFIFHYDNGEFYDVHCALINDYLQIYKRKNNWVSNRREFRYATEEEKQKLFDAIKANGYKWNAETKTLEKLKTFKFALQSIVKHKSTNIRYRVIGRRMTKIKDSMVCVYQLHNIIDNSTKIVYEVDEDNYILVPNKFDVTTLKAFDRVLVRNTNSELWRISLFGCFSNEERYFMCMANSAFYQCIPYNEDTKHLVGTADDCDDFYKTWENNN